MFAHNALRAVAVACAMVILTVAVSVAGAPNVMNYQGRLTDDVGTPLNGSFDLTFNLYNVPAGGSPLWTETHLNVAVVGGLFNVLLGESIGLTDFEFEDADRYLGVTVEADPEMTPRTRMTAVGYAYRVSTIDGASGGTVDGDILLQSTAAVNAMEISQNGLGRGLRIGMNNAGSSEAGLAIAMQSGGAAIQIVPDGGGSAIDVFGGFGDASVNLPQSSIGGFEIADGSLTADDLASGSVETSEILNGTITNADIAFDEISSTHLSNEAGAVQAVLAPAFSLTSSVASYVTVTLNAPASGYALVIGSATGTIVHNNGENNQMEFGVSETGNTLDADQVKLWNIPSVLPTGAHRQVMSAQKIFPVGAGNNSFYLCARDSGGASGKTIGDMTLSVVYIPTAYGSVSQ